MKTTIVIYLILNALWVWFALYKVGQYSTAKWYHKLLTFVINLIIFPIALVVAIRTGKFTTQAEGEQTYTGENEKWFQLNELITIYRNDKTPYLVRRTLISFGQWFSIKYHKILVSDDPCMHCHPWPFLTIILKGGYFEWTPVYQKDSGEKIDTEFSVNGEMVHCHFHEPGSIMYRPAKWIHRLVLADANANDPEQEVRLEPAHTLVFTGKVIRDWGFYTKNGWVFWKNYDSKRDC